LRGLWMVGCGDVIGRFAWEGLVDVI
jgi:hypothetical protein